MSIALPPRPNLDWLRKTARQRLREWRTKNPDAKLAEVQFTLAREHGFSSWRSLKSHIEAWERQSCTGAVTSTDEQIAEFLRAVGSGQMDVIRSSISSMPLLVNAVGPHPYWGGRPQALHVSIETARQDVFDILLSSGADVNGKNDEYEHCSPLMLSVHWKQPRMQQELLRRGAKVGLVEALLLGDDALVARLLKSGTSAIPKFNPNGGSILAMARTPFAIDRMLELGVSSDRKDRWGAPPIEALSRLGSAGLPLVRHLASKGFEVSPQELARLGDHESLRRLLEHKKRRIDLDHVFQSAAEFGHHEIVEWLLTQGANVDAKSSTGNGWTALHSAAWEGDLRMAKILVAAGADVRIRDKEHHATPAKCARVAIEVTNNPECQVVAEYLDEVERREGMVG